VAGNRKAFEEAMQIAANAAWDRQWDKAIAAYQRALGEFPRDAGALTGLGVACYGAGQLEAALDAYQQASALTPDDPVLLERIAQTQEQLNQGRAAAEAYMTAAERYIGQQQAAHLALACWQKAANAWPECLQAHAQLLHYYQGQGLIKEAVGECLALARAYRSQGRVDRASQVCEHALKLAPHDPEVLAALDSLRYAEPVAVDATIGVSQTEPGAWSEVGGAAAPVTMDFAAPPAESLEDRSSPVAIARHKALTDLAESFFEEEAPMAPAGAARLDKAEIDALVGRAIDLQTRAKVDEAIAAYENVVAAGVDQPAVHFNLGLLYQEKLRFDSAIAQFQRTVAYPEYMLGSHFALGECHRAKGRVDEALEQFIEVLKIVDLATVRREQADDLIQLYEHLADGYVAKGDRDQALEFTNSLVTFLTEQGWEDKVVQARRRLDAVAEEGPTLSLAEMLASPDSERILESVALSQEYTKRRMFYAALEECYSALGSAPAYLPTHRQLAQILLAMGKTEEAVSKLVTIAGAYLARGDVRHGIGMYRRALQLAPMNTTVRVRLIGVLVSHGAIEEALEHYLMLADSYYNLAQMDQARETYQEALRLAPRGDPSKRWAVRILHKIGDIDMQRVDWKRAISDYEQIRKIAPDDERARLMLMELYYRLARPDLAMIELDNLIKLYREGGKMPRVFAILEDVVREHPDDIPLRTRMAQAYLDAGKIEEAIQHLDKLGDLQLTAGRVEEARATIQVILRLNPPNIAAYRQLLEQIGGQVRR
jgi:tetratricopeptide (TPR) repeat protein